MSSAALMSPPHTVRVGDAVTLHILQTERFKTARLSISAILPADQVLSPRMTLLFGVLRRGSRRFPSQLHINRRLDELYGATLTIRNFHAGDRQVLGFTAEMLDDSCLPAADRGLDILGGVADLLAGLILEPLTDEDGVLRRRSVEQEKQALCDAILADRNQARSYAEGRMRHILYGQEPSGVSLFGRPEQIRDVTAEQLTALWQSFLACARLEVFYVGKASPETLEAHGRRLRLSSQPAAHCRPPCLMLRRLCRAAWTKRAVSHRGGCAWGGHRVSPSPKTGNCCQPPSCSMRCWASCRTVCCFAMCGRSWDFATTAIRRFSVPRAC